MADDQTPAVPQEGYLHSLATSLGIDPEAVKVAAHAIFTNPKQAASEIGHEISDEAAEMVRKPVDSSKEVGTGVVSALTNPDAQTVAKQRFAQPGVVNKVSGALQYLESGVPIIGGGLAKSQEQATEGNAAGSLGTLTGIFGPILLHEAGPEGSLKPTIEDAKTHVQETGKVLAQGVKEGAQAALEAKAPAGSSEAGFAKLRGKAKPKAVKVPDAFEAATGTKPLTEAEPEKPEMHPSLSRLAEQHGIKYQPAQGAGFIVPDGRVIELKGGDTHPEAIADVSGQDRKAAASGPDNRPDYLERTGAVRTRIRIGRDGTTLHVSVPKQGVTPEQIQSIREAVGTIGRGGNMVLERSDVKPATASTLATSKEFVSPRDVEPMLKQIGAHPDQAEAVSPKEPVSAPAETGAKASQKDVPVKADEKPAAPKEQNSDEPVLDKSIMYQEHPMGKIEPKYNEQNRWDKNPYGYLLGNGHFVEAQSGEWTHDQMADWIGHGRLIDNNAIRVHGPDNFEIMHGAPTEQQRAEIARFAKQSGRDTINWDFHRLQPEDVEDYLRQEDRQVVPAESGQGRIGDFLRASDKFYGAKEEPPAPPTKQNIPAGSKFVPSTPEEYRAELDRSPRAAEFLADSAEELKGHKIFKLHSPEGKDTGIAYSISPKGEMRGVVNNSPYSGAAAQAIQHGFENGATHTEPAWDVNDRLANMYKDAGHKNVVSEPYDAATYGEPSEPMKAAWKKAGWKEGEPYPKFTRLEADNAVTPNEELKTSAQKYAKTKGMAEIDHTPVQQDPARAREIAQQYHNAEDAPNDPKVKAAYDAMKAETKDQFHHLRDDLGLKFEPQAEDPYKSAGEMMNDVRTNKRLKVFTSSGPGANHPLSEIDPETGESYNTIFRWVHDALGHAAGGNDFSENGEKSATEAHAQMYSDVARPAMRAETEGQTSWFFHNPDVESGAKQPGEFAPQKATTIEDAPKASDYPSYDYPPYTPPSGDNFFMFASPTEHAAEFKPGEWDNPEHLKPAEAMAAKTSAGAVDPRTGKFDNAGIGVEILPEYRQALDHPPTAAEIQAFYQKNKTLFQNNPELRVGWDNESAAQGGHELNIGAVGPEAARVAKKLDQRAAFDIAKGEDVLTGGKGVRTEFPNYPLEDRMKDLRGEPLSDIPGFEHLSKDVHEDLAPDEAESLKGNKTLQRNVMQKYHELEPSVEETTNAMQAGAALGGWWQRFIDIFHHLTTPEAEQVAKTIGPSHAEILKQIHSGLSANKPVDQANNLAWNFYADWLDEGQPKDRKSIDTILKRHGAEKGERTGGAGNASITDTYKKGKVVNEGIDTSKMFNLISSPEMRGERPFSNAVFSETTPNALMGPTKGARKIPSMGATVAGKGNLNRLVIDTHIRDFYGQKPQGSAPQYIADSVHLRKAAKALGLQGGEGQEQLWGTVLGLKYLLKEGLTPPEAAGTLSAKVIEQIGKDYAEVIANDPELTQKGGILDRLKEKHGIGRGSAGFSEAYSKARGPRAGEGKPAGSQAPVNQALSEKTAGRIRKVIPEQAIKKLSEAGELFGHGDTSFNFGANEK